MVPAPPTLRNDPDPSPHLGGLDQQPDKAHSNALRARGRGSSKRHFRVYRKVKRQPDRKKTKELTRKERTKSKRAGREGGAALGAGREKTASKRKKGSKSKLSPIYDIIPASHTFSKCQNIIGLGKLSIY